MNIRVIADNLKENALPLALGVGGVVILFSLLSGKEQEAELVPATGFVSYPDVGQNANVVISSIQDTVTAGDKEIMDQLLSQNEFFTESLQTVIDKTDTSTTEIMGALDTQNDLLHKIDKTSSSINSKVGNLNSYSEKIAAGISGIKGELESSHTFTSK